jgi:hypothetical protein
VGNGSAVTVTAAGFVLDDEMDDFTAAPGKPNLSWTLWTLRASIINGSPDFLNVAESGFVQSLLASLEAMGHTMHVCATRPASMRSRSPPSAAPPDGAVPLSMAEI